MAEARFSPRAARDLDAIFDYTVVQWGLEQAERYTDAIEAACRELAEMPGLAPRCDHYRQGYRRRAIERHAIFFRETDYGIAVVRILHGSMDVRRHL
jgi:toxin ParE1/3/4